jgi:hypothetical protein
MEILLYEKVKAEFKPWTETYLVPIQKQRFPVIRRAPEK